MKSWRSFFERKQKIITINADIVGRAFAEIVITALINWKPFSINDESDKCVKDEEQYLLAFAIGYVIDDVLKDTPEGNVVRASYNECLEKRINELNIDKSFLENLTKSRTIAYQKSLKNPESKYWFVDLGNSFSSFCGYIEKPELISEGILFFTISANSFRKSLESMKVVL